MYCGEDVVLVVALTARLAGVLERDREWDRDRARDWREGKAGASAVGGGAGLGERPIRARCLGVKGMSVIVSLR